MKCDGEEGLSYIRGFIKVDRGRHRNLYGEHDRVRVIHKYVLDKIQKVKAQELFKRETIHEKKYGDRAGGKKRKYQYEEERAVANVPPTKKMARDRKNYYQETPKKINK
ncbi:Uncharacterised protein g11120 [Pycnogonum litorale]